MLANVAPYLGLISAGALLVASGALGFSAFALFKLSRLYSAKDR